MTVKQVIPIIDLFAGPGGLGEGFNSLRIKKRHPFKVKLSIEKDENACVIDMLCHSGVTSNKKQRKITSHFYVTH